MGQAIMPLPIPEPEPLPDPESFDTAIGNVKVLLVEWPRLSVTVITNRVVVFDVSGIAAEPIVPLMRPDGLKESPAGRVLPDARVKVMVPVPP
jgi:hypothetical protein